MNLLNEPQKPCFLVFEGIDGSGKSLLSRMVHGELGRLGYDSVWTCEPSDKARAKIREANSEWDVLFAFLQDRAEHKERIQAWMAEGKVVVCDRYIPSTYAYQGPRLEKMIPNAYDWLMRINSPLAVPVNRYYFLDVDPKVAMERLSERKNKESFETMSQMSQAGEQYRKMATNQGWVTVNAEQSVTQVFEQIMADVRGLVA